MQVISNFSLKKFGKTQKTGVSYSVLLLIDSYLGFSVRCYFFAKFCCFISTTKKFNCKNIFYLILISINSKKKEKKKKEPILNQICKKIAPIEKNKQLYSVSSKIILHLIECVCLPFQGASRRSRSPTRSVSPSPRPRSRSRSASPSRRIRSRSVSPSRSRSPFSSGAW